MNQNDLLILVLLVFRQGNNKLYIDYFNFFVYDGIFL